MKPLLLHMLLLAGLVGCQAGPTQEKATAPPTPAADSLPPAPVSTGEFAFQISATPTDSSLVFPVVRQPANLCRALEQAWQAYLRQHPTFRRRFPMEASTLGMSTSFWLTLDQRGRVQDVSKSSSTALKDCCYQALKPTLQRSVWRPFYRKTKAGKRYAPLKVNVNCYLSPAYKLTLRLDGYGPLVGFGICTCGRP